MPGLIQGLSTGVQAELDKLTPAGWVLRLAPRPPFLAGREGLLADLDARLAGGDSREPRLVVLHGLAGAGKSSLALAYAHTHLADAGITWQFAAEDAAVLAAGFAELAVALGAQQEGVDPVVAVHGALATSRAGWLLIFDNAPSPEAVEAFLPPAGRGRVLITSRHALWPGVQAVEVPALGLDAAAGFLVARSGDADRQAAAGLAEAVGGLPLALEQAGAYIQASGGSLAGYLGSFRKRRPELLARGMPTGYDSTVAATWSLAFTELQQSAPQAVGLLHLVAFCAPEPVPLRLLLQPRPELAGEFAGEVAAALVPLLEDELAAGDAVAALRRYSLVTPAGDGLVSVHRLVQAVTTDQMPEELRQGWRAAAAALIGAAVPVDTSLPQAWPGCALLLPHVLAALDLTSGGVKRIADYLGLSGSYPAARDLFQQIADAYSEDAAYGPEHEDTLTARRDLANWTGWAGDAAGARDQYAALLP
ncbi:MAG TPA: ATP-binding protein, partial [Streptosporangiaceae bacterium]|nr:ATP-binding protein [Streptosporangiaceae bacterium]